MELTFNFEQISLADTDVLDIDFNKVLTSKYGIAVLEYVSGTAVQADASRLGTTITSATGSISSANPKMLVAIEEDYPLQVKGDSDSIFTVSILPDR